MDLVQKKLLTLYYGLLSSNQMAAVRRQSQECSLCANQMLKTWLGGAPGVCLCPP